MHWVLESVKLYADREYAYLDQKIEAEVETTFDVTWFHAQLSPIQMTFLF